MYFICILRKTEKSIHIISGSQWHLTHFISFSFLKYASLLAFMIWPSPWCSAFYCSSQFPWLSACLIVFLNLCFSWLVSRYRYDVVPSSLSKLSPGDLHPQGFEYHLVVSDSPISTSGPPFFNELYRSRTSEFLLLHLRGISKLVRLKQNSSFTNPPTPSSSWLLEIPARCECLHFPTPRLTWHSFALLRRISHHCPHFLALLIRTQSLSVKPPV